MRFFVGIDGATAGPFDLVQLVTLYEAGVIDGSTQCQSVDQSGSWKPLSTAVPSLARIVIKAGGGEQRVSVSDLEMRFGSMMSFMVKWVFASIPAAIIVIFIGTILFLVLGGVFTALFSGLHGVK